MTKVSITLPSIFPEALRRAHDNIFEQTVGPFELIIVADFDRPSWVCDEVIWVREEKRQGCNHAQGVAARYATGEFITAMADDCIYFPAWDDIAKNVFLAREADAGQMLSLGLSYGSVGTVFGMYFANFPFMRRTDALALGYYDGNYKRDLGDCDLGLKVWAAGGRCEFTERKLIEITAADMRKGVVLPNDDDLGYFIEKWGNRYGRGFDLSYIRGFNFEVDLFAHPELIDCFSIHHNNQPEFIKKLLAAALPYLIESTLRWNIVWLGGVFYALPHSAGVIRLNVEDDRVRVLEMGGALFDTVAEARSYVLRMEANLRDDNFI